jgi:hypothetical protein
VDPAAILISRIYLWNYSQLGPKGLDLFVNSLHQLGLGFTEVQVMRIAGSCKLLPLPRNHALSSGSGLLPCFQPEVGGFGCISYRHAKDVGWEPLGVSRHAQHGVRRGLSLLLYCLLLRRTCILLPRPDLLDWSGPTHQHQMAAGGSRMIALIFLFLIYD